MSFGMTQWRGECPRCKRVWTLPQGTPYMECDCHLICEDGVVVQDCDVAPYNWSGSYGFPTGVDYQHSDLADRKYRATGYCSIHDNYVYKPRIVEEIDWDTYLRTRLPKRLRWPAMT